MLIPNSSLQPQPVPLSPRPIGLSARILLQDGLRRREKQSAFLSGFDAAQEAFHHHGRASVPFAVEAKRREAERRGREARGHLEVNVNPIIIADSLGVQPPTRFIRPRKGRKYDPPAYLEWTSGTGLIDHSDSYRSCLSGWPLTWKDYFVVTQPYLPRDQILLVEKAINSDASCPFYVMVLDDEIGWYAPGTARIAILYGRELAHVLSS